MVCDAVVPGLGHLYLGAPTQAFVIAALFVALVPILVCCIVALDRSLGLAAWLLAAGPWLLRLLAAAHVGLFAKPTPRIEPNRSQTLGTYLLFAVTVLSVQQATARLVRARVVELATMPADSGQPNVVAGDGIVITKLRARDRAAQRGDLISFMALDGQALFLKRVIALEGESVSIIGGRVHIDGVALATSPCESTDDLVLDHGATCLIEHTPEGSAHVIQLLRESTSNDWGPVEIPDGHVFVLGDNRSASHDSRAFGPVPRSAITGRVRAIWTPSARARSL